MILYRRLYAMFSWEDPFQVDTDAWNDLVDKINTEEESERTKAPKRSRPLEDEQGSQPMKVSLSQP